jgi:hypothetical protein
MILLNNQYQCDEKECRRDCCYRENEVLPGIENPKPDSNFFATVRSLCN